MCAIFGSSSKEKIIELAHLNSSRGSHSYSVSGYFPSEHRFENVAKILGEFHPDTLDMLDAPYYVCHIQAPTTEVKDQSSIHPAYDRGDYLLHNGIIKEDQIKEWQDAWGDDEKWDTKWLLHNLNTGDVGGTLSETDGGYACVWYHQYSKALRLFRNEFTPLFINLSNFDISSTKSDGMTPLKPNEVIALDFQDFAVTVINTFETKNNPYFFGV